jgi:hypothetical protein
MLFLRSNDVGHGLVDRLRFETIQTGLRSRPRSPAETDEERTIADGLAMFADPAIARARDLLDRTADWGPDMVVQEVYELGGMYIPAHLHVLHGLGAHSSSRN